MFSLFSWKTFVRRTKQVFESSVFVTDFSDNPKLPCSDSQRLSTYFRLCCWNHIWEREHRRFGMIGTNMSCGKSEPYIGRRPDELSPRPAEGWSQRLNLNEKPARPENCRCHRHCCRPCLRPLRCGGDGRNERRLQKRPKNGHSSPWLGRILSTTFVRKLWQQETMGPVLVQWGLVGLFWTYLQSLNILKDSKIQQKQKVSQNGV